MQRFFLLLLIFSVHFFVVSAQPNEAEQLTNQVADLFKQGKIDEALPLAEKAVLLLKKAPNKDTQQLAVAYTNLAVLKKEKGIRIFKNLAKDRNRTQSKELSSFHEYESEAESLFKEVIEIHEKQLKSASPQLALSLGELAWLKANYLPTTLRIGDAQKRLEDAEGLYFQSLVLKEKIFGMGHDSTQGTLLEFAEFQLLRLEIEKAIPLYERYIKILEKTKGADHKGLIVPLRALALIRISTDQEKKAKDSCERISKLTGQPENLPTANINLSRRVVSGQDLPSIGTFYIQTSGLQIIGFPGGIANDDIVPVIASGLSPVATDAFFGFFIDSPSFPKPPKRVNVRVTIDETGKVAEASAVSNDEKLKKRAEKEVLKWKFKPFVYESVAKKMAGWAVFYEF